MTANTLAARNRNPLNLRPLPGADRWKGQVSVSTNSVTGSFSVFESNVMGVRAAVVNMRSYVQYAGVVDLKGVIYRWAPPPAGGLTGTAGSAVNGVDQNHTSEYLNFVCTAAKVSPTFSFLPITSGRPSQEFVQALARIVRAMNHVEAGGYTITPEEAVEGVQLALNLPEGYTRQDGGNVVRKRMAQSETIKLNTKGQVANLLGTGTSAMTVFATIQDWRVAAIVAGLVVVVGASVAYYLLKLRKDRQDMNEFDIA